MPSQRPRIRLPQLLPLALLLLPTLAAAQEERPAPPPKGCNRLIQAGVVALDQVFFWNRYGAVEPQGMIYALEHDVVSTGPGANLEPGKVALRPGKRPRPLVLRMNEGDCIAIHFRNLLNPSPEDEEQPHTRAASIHVVGMELLQTIRDDGSNVGANGSAGNGVVMPGDSITYMLYAEREGGYLMHSMGAIAGGEGDGGSISAGLFGAINVEPAGSEWYRSQVTREDLDLASTPDANGFPVIDYDAFYPPTHPKAGSPILKMMWENIIFHSDLTAIITGPGADNFDGSYPYPTTPTFPDRNQPFREFTIIFHDEIGAVQAFPHFEDEILQFPLHSVRDAFAINYGTGGIGAEILANRIGVGPVHDCDECKYEEFFLSSWAVGDPAMVVDVPASKPCSISDLKVGKNCQPQLGRKATVAFFPDDPSNVYHSYLNEHVKFRNLHAGTDDHHVFHLHAHQWVHTPRSDQSAYLDSQTIGQGASFTYEIAYRGSGNRNRTVGDAIFHCHFYPHFAQGMWGLWRVHDVLELGTELDKEGKPVEKARALPDGEIAQGTPIPAVVPIPVLPMAPLPGHIAIVDGQVDLSTWDGKHPGYPFFIPGRAGRRPPHPPLDTIHDGGLARHVVIDGSAVSTETRHDFSKVLLKAEVDWLDEAGEPIEKKAMEFHANAAGYPSPTPKGGSGIFKVNGAPPVRGAPYADPCIKDNGAPVTDMRYYKAADIQLDTFLNKKRWHYPQQRIISLWNDVDDYLSPLAGTPPKPPEPLFMRVESGECVEFWLANLTPSEYHLDDFQVRTPTDILGQHIHLVKFDVTSSDGAANGFNYEDGSFAPEEVQERIEAIRAANNCAAGDVDKEKCPKPEPHPFFGGSHDADCDGHNDWLGAQTTVQRWWADPITTMNGGGERTIRTVFTHDHFGPSTHQQVGLYAGLVVEPKGSRWYHNETGIPLSTDNSPGLTHDGGPTSWQAKVEGVTEEETYREFMVAFADFQLAYEPGSPLCPVYSGGGNGLADPARAINPPGRKELPPPVLYEKPDVCPTNENDPDGPILPNPEGLLPPCPEAVSADDPGMVAVNYRNEPVALRVRDPDTKEQAAGQPGDLSFAYASLTNRADPDLNVQPGFYPPLTKGLTPGDPFTPLFRVFEGDRVHVRILVGAHEEPHNFTVHGVKWLSEPDYPNSGYRNSQGMGISEWFDFVVPRVPSLKDGELADFLYKPSSASEWQWTGMWGLLRVYRDGNTEDLTRLSTNEQGRAPSTDADLAEIPQEEAENQKIPGAEKEAAPIKIVCPNDIPVTKYRVYNVVAVWAQEALQDDPGTLDALIYNRRDTPVKIHHDDFDPPEPDVRFGPLNDPTAIMFVRHEDLDWVPSPTGPRPRVKQTVRREPLILRANAGECVRINLLNAIPEKYEDLPGWNAMPMIIEGFNANDVVPSLHVGLHPQLLYYDIRRSDGTNVGLNPNYAVQTVPPGQKVAYYLYAGDYTPGARLRPIEFGSTGLSSADPIKHSNKGAVGALIVEPPDTTWDETIVDSDGKLTRAAAAINYGAASFLENVLVFQDDVNQRYADGAPVENLEVGADPEGSGQKAVNYRTEPVWFRIGLAPDWPAEETREFTMFDQVLSNDWIGGYDPETPVFVAGAGKTVRFRAVHPGGHTQSHVFDLHGHIWQELPYVANSSALGDNPESEWQGARGGHGPSNHFDVLVQHGAGGRFTVAGDYLYRDYAAWLLDGGIWGLFRVVP